MVKTKRISSMITVSLLLTSLMAACGNNNNANESSNANASASADANTDSASNATPEASKEPEKPLEYSFLDLYRSAKPVGIDNPNDVVTPWVEKKFNIKLKEYTTGGDRTATDVLNMMVAAGNLPDVVIVPHPFKAQFYETGQFADLSEYKDLLVNMNQYTSDLGWNNLSLDGKLVGLPNTAEPDMTKPDLASQVNSDIFYQPLNNWVPVVREDILKQLGYTFKPLSQLQGELDANPRQIALDDATLEPAINTFEDFEKLLYQIKDLHLKVDGKELIPLEMPDWGAYHFSVLFSPTGGWYYDKAADKVTGYLDNPGMKEYYQTLAKWMKDGILDKNWLINKPEQAQEKIASGRVAVTMWAPDMTAARNALKAKNPEAEMHPINWPAPKYAEKSYVDAASPAGWPIFMINKNVKDIPRLLKYFDWFYSEEGKDITAWGPEEAGLWEMKDGKKVFKDEKLWEAIRDTKKTEDGKNQEYYGILGTSESSITAPAPGYNNKTPYYSYPIKLDAYDRLHIYLSNPKISYDGSVLPAMTGASSETNGYYWSTARQKVAQILSAKSDAAFDKQWDEVVNDFKQKSNYDAAVQEMKKAFDNVLSGK
ncbi:hypothetical protein [Paenibacillus glycanilyticus]|uniref:ABC transporter substrate-binding protein n=1 Tax=Paenibacillus glycanilyticus TaxID=126569 RepID=A0ABQ6GB91_9BACL|nr:hypothetical protein [Paenibacillus glycanilyticus]GLX67505.1 hypothetical protein MU1_18500 [Paenibacillus glycanilyticus]